MDIETALLLLKKVGREFVGNLETKENDFYFSSACGACGACGTFEKKSKKDH